MDIDTLFTVIFVVFIILFQLFGTVVSRLAKRDQDAKPEKPGGLLNTLKNRVFSEIQIAMQQAASAQGRSEGLSQPAETPAQTPKEARLSRPVAKKATASSAVPAREEDALIAEIRQGLMNDDVDVTTATETQKSERKHAPTGTGYSRADLRRAVIWSEILAPPLALRD